MAVQYPDYRADPNGTPQINGAPGFISAVEKGYKLAQLPEQMKQEALMKRAQLAKAQADTTGQENVNNSYQQELAARLAQSAATTANTQATTGYTNKQTSRYDDTVNSALARDRALNANTYANTALTGTQNKAATYELQQQQAIIAAIRAAQQAAQNGQQPQDGAPQPQQQPPGGYGGSAPQPQYQPGQGGAMYAPPQQNIGAPQQPQGGMPMQGTVPQTQPPTAGGAAPTPPIPSNEKLIQPGNKAQAYLDELSQNPLYAKYLEKMGVSAPKIDTKYNATSGQIITTTTWPSGKVTASATPLTDGSNGIQVSTDDQGRPIVKIGGSASGNRSGGGLATDAYGNLISNPTTTTQTNLQQRDIGKDVAVPYLDELANNLPQFQNLGKRGLTAAEGVLNNFGADFKAPSEKATGESAITLASEGLLKAFGLYGAHANIEEVKATLRPQWGESKKGYEKRIQAYKADTINNAIAQKEKLAGIKVRENDTKKLDAAKVKHLTDNYSLEQLKEMQGTAQ